MENNVIISKTSCNIKNYNGIDVAKFLCSFLVVAIHISPLNSPMDGELSSASVLINDVFQLILCRIAVPFFFVCSGFFLFHKMPAGTLDVVRIKNYCYKMLRLLGMWSVLLFWGGSGHLWYLGATVVAVVLLSICLHHGIKVRWLVLMACTLYTFGLLGDSYNGLIKPFVGSGIMMYIYAAYDFVIGYSRNGILMGFIFVLIGYLFARYKIRLRLSTALAGFIGSTLCMCAEVFLLEQNNISTSNNMYISLLPVVFFLFAFTSSLPLASRPIYAKLRTVGVLVYFLHLFINRGIWAVKMFLYKFIHLDIQPLQFFIVLAAAVLIAFGIEWLSHKERFKWIQWFLS